MNPSPTKNGKISWPESSSFKQNFCLPDSIVYNIAKNPSTPKCYLKLAKSCKYFFEKNPLLVVTQIFDSGRQFCALNSHSWSKRCCVKFDISKLTSKIWLIVEFTLQEDVIPNAATLFSRNIYRCETAQLYVYSKSSTSLEDFKIWAKIFQKFNIYNVYNINGITATFNSIIEVISSLHTLYYNFNRNIPAATTSTMIKITELKNFGNLRKLVLDYVPEILNIDDLEKFIKNQKDTKIWLCFSDNISVGYRARLNQLIDTIISTKRSNCAILYDGLDKEKRNNMCSRYNC